MTFKSALTFPLLAASLLIGCGPSDEPKQAAAEPAAPTPPAAEAAPSDSYLEKIKARDKLIVGVFSDKPPFGFVNEQGEYVGFDTDIAKRFAKDLLGDEKKVEFVVVEPASRIPFLQSDKVDLILANMTVTPERAEAVDFTNPNLRVAVQALVADGSDVQKLDDLADKTTIVTTGTTADIWLTRNHPEWKLLKFEKNSESLQALANGRGDAYAQDNLVLFSWAKQNPGYRVLAETLGDEAPIAPAVKKGNSELRDWVNDELAKLGEEKFLLSLYDQYVRPELAEGTDPEAIIVEGGKWEE
ncbi:glutamine ABC transporter substrate-binding protein [Pseudomonas daroniae]|uniref:Glutamine ABC transporter substrate-binding protein n=1 Tax=Phytopseudomonas daroniae TaxID=2487519 RepID=A0A4Q9QL34_9GAMM|nr:MULTISPECIES: transporter substrate-binding domain-containing protein [Pseudomonas]TBU77928.1 glutamine ABC transporter substrate-binding protein [Pseudomonas daroniae]TBU82276.1 glutamine ABC transporter substrate-binding protein [Pseudomonas sp. FRB 228]TBU91097.1 glutamine ABC transporter substrate-binding protein [Pseudomonas daroniae]